MDLVHKTAGFICLRKCRHLVDVNNHQPGSNKTSATQTFYY